MTRHPSLGLVQHSHGCCSLSDKTWHPEICIVTVSQCCWFHGDYFQNDVSDYFSTSQSDCLHLIGSELHLASRQTHSFHGHFSRWTLVSQLPPWFGSPVIPQRSQGNHWQNGIFYRLDTLPAAELNNNNDNHDDIYSDVITNKVIAREFTRFIWWM